MPNPLKPKIKQAIVLNMDIDTALASLQKEFGATWQIESRRINSDTIDFRATREGVEILGHLERWQGTESRLHLDGEVLLKTPYESWREWSGVGSFLALVAIWILLAILPITAATFENFYLIMTKSFTIPLMISILAIFLGIPFLLHRYFTKLSPDIRLYEEAQSHLANFVSSVKNLQNSQQPDTSRLEEQEEMPISESSPESSKTHVDFHNN